VSRIKTTLLTNLISSSFIFLFAYTAISKLLEYKSFAFTLSESPLIHKGAGVLAWLIPASELVIVLLLFFSTTQLKGLYGAVLLLLVFTSYLILMLLSDSKLPCSCGGVISGMSWKEHVGFNILFMVLGGIGIRRKKLEERRMKS
jgi:hypothetical protein